MSTWAMAVMSVLSASVRLTLLIAVRVTIRGEVLVSLPRTDVEHQCLEPSARSRMMSIQCGRKAPGNEGDRRTSEAVCLVVVEGWQGEAVRLGPCLRGSRTKQRGRFKCINGHTFSFLLPYE